MDIAIAGAPLAGIVLGLVLAIAAFTFFMKYHFSKGFRENLSFKKEIATNSLLAIRKKYKEADVFGHRSTFLHLSLALALGFVTLAFSWTQYEPEFYIPTDLSMDDYIDETIPPTVQNPPPPPPPPPPPVIEAVPEEDIIEDEEPEFVDTSIDEDTEVMTPPVLDKPVPPPPPPPPPVVSEPDFWKVVEEMPRFPGCEDIVGTKAEKRACADRKMLEFLYQHIKYPAIARENGVKGTVVIQFLVERNGSIQNAKIIRDIGANCGTEALRVVNLMNTKGLKWIPGMQQGRKVRVQFNLPVRFRLE